MGTPSTRPVCWICDRQGFHTYRHLSKGFPVECMASGTFWIRLLLPFLGMNPKDLGLYAGDIPHLPMLVGAELERALDEQPVLRGMLFPYFFLALFWLRQHISPVSLSVHFFFFPRTLCSSDFPKVAKPFWSYICSQGTVVYSKLDCFC